MGLEDTGILDLDECMDVKVYCPIMKDSSRELARIRDDEVLDKDYIRFGEDWSYLGSQVVGGEIKERY